MSVDLIESIESIADSEEDISIKELPLESWHLLEDAFSLMRSPLPDPDTSSIIVLTKGDKILTFVVLQKTLHAEPHFVYPEGQHQHLSEILYDAIHTIATGVFNIPYFVIIQDPALARKAEHNGFTEVPGKLYVRGKVG